MSEFPQRKRWVKPSISKQVDKRSLHLMEMSDESEQDLAENPDKNCDKHICSSKTNNDIISGQPCLEKEDSDKREHIIWGNTNQSVSSYFGPSVLEAQEHEILPSATSEHIPKTARSDAQENAAIYSDGGGRMQSPSSVSSITSCKRLEWDSGADVGYGGNEVINDQVLSTIERLALAQGCSVVFPERAEPDDKSSPAISQTKVKLTPLAHSTPHEDPTVNETNLAEGTVITPIILHSNQVNDNQKCVPTTTSKCEMSYKKDGEVKANSLPTKLSNNDEVDKSTKSFETTGKHDVGNCVIQRSHSDLSLNQTKNDNSSGLFLAHKFLNELNIAGVHSGSSSSVSTVVHNKTKSLKNRSQKSVGIQVDAPQVTTTDANFIVDTPISSKLNGKVGKSIFKSSKLIACNDNMLHSSADQHEKLVARDEIITEDVKCSTNCDQIHLDGTNEDVDPGIEPNTNKPVNSVIDSINKRLVQVCGTLGSASSSTQTASSWCVNERKDQQICSEVIGSANSFEYLPGHMYENNSDIHANSVNEKSGLESSRSTSSEACSAQLKPDDSVLWSSASSTLSRDLEKSIRMLQKLLDGRKDDPRLKNKLIGMVVNRLVNTNYKHDSKDIDSLCSSNSQEFNLHKKNKPASSEEILKKSLSSSSANSSVLMREPLKNRSKGIKQGGNNHSTLESTSSGSISIPVQAGSRTETSNSYCNSSTSSTVRRRHWEEPATLSEKKLETNRKNQGGVNDYCEMERAHQLSWIEYEIEQLSNLKRFLKNKNDSPVNKTSLTNGVVDSNRSQREQHVSSAESMLNSGSLLEASGLHNSKDKRSLLMDPVSLSKVNDTETVSSHRTNEKYCVKTNELERELLYSKSNLFHPSQKTRKGQRDIVVDMKVRAGNKTIIKVLEKAELSDTLTSYSVSDSSKNISHHNGFQRSESSSSGIINVYSETVGKNPNSTSNCKQKPIPSANLDVSASSHVMCCCECQEELEWIREYRKLLNERVLNRKIKKCVHKNINETSSDRESPHDVYKICKGKVINGSNVSSRPLSENTMASNTLSETDTDSKTRDISRRKKTHEDEVLQPSNLQNSGKVSAQETKGGSHESLNFSTVPNLSDCQERKAKLPHPITEENSEKKSCPCCRNVEAIHLYELPKENFWNRNGADNEMNQKISHHDPFNDATTVDEQSGNNFLKHSSDALVSPENTSVSEIIEPEPKQLQSIAYILTFEADTDNTTLNKSSERKKSLEEIKIRIPAKKLSPNKHATLKGKKKNNNKFKVRGQHLKKNTEEVNENECPNGNKPLKKLTLQECLLSKRPDYIKNAEERKRCLTEWAKFRETKQNNRQKLLTLGIASTIKDKPENNLIFSGRRILSQKEMRKLTERKYRRLPEVVEKKTEIKRKNEYRTNKLMAEVFTKKLQKKTLRGEVNLSNSVTVLSTSNM